MRFSTSEQLHINGHLKAHLGYKSCPRTLGTEDLAGLEPTISWLRVHEIVG